MRIAAENTRGGRERNHADLDLDLEVEDDENDDEGG